MFQREAAVALSAVLIAILSSVHGQQTQTQQPQSQEAEQTLWQAFPLDAPLATPPRLAPDYVNGVLSLKESLLRKSDGNRYAMTSQPEQVQKPQQQVQLQEPENNVDYFGELRPSRLSYQSLKKLMEMPAVVEAIAQQVPFITPSAAENENVKEFTEQHNLELPFMELSAPQPAAEPEEFRPQRTAQTGDQASLLQQLQQFFGMHPKNQPDTNGAALACTEAPDISEDTEECATESPDEGETTEEPKDGEKVIVDVKPAKPDKKKDKGKATTSTPKPTSKPKTKTTKKLACCTKASKKISGLLPISISLNFQNEQSPETKEHQAQQQQQQQPRTGRHVFRPDLQMDAFTNLLRYRREREGEAFGHNELESSDLQLQAQQRKPRENPGGRKKRRLLDRQRLLQAEVKLWPINIRNTIDRVH
ncbi:neurofilament heavy polypeptide [Drosophila obscura]|uniref:neurofilament heavy polypeptide n=1 Tax=Drosophila obscura TaxID=7282 RepID=UPI001BB15F8F|nr:neurofilament heavy polypeptide [Drosophila obscura]